MKLTEKLLLSLSTSPSAGGGYDVDEHYTEQNAFSILRRVYPDFECKFAGKTILDFGCGFGLQSIALSRIAKRVVGLDITPEYIARAKRNAAAAGCNANLEFTDSTNETFDIILSQNSMEHFIEPEKILSIMKSRLAPSGSILITFGPPWYAPYGAHMTFFTKLPWVNLLFSERTVMEVRKKFRQDGATSYREAGVAEMSLRKFERLVRASGLRIKYRKYECVKGLNFLATIPILRELFVNHVTVELVASA